MKRNAKHIILLIALFFVLITVFSFTVGRYPIAWGDLAAFLFGGRCVDGNVPVLIAQVRLPRILGALLTGGALAVSGAAYQGLFRNPMVSPDILGVSSGAGFGATLAILFSAGVFAVQVSAFAMGLLAVMVALAVSRMMHGQHDKILMLVLSGMTVSAMFGALISLMKYVADSESKLPDIVFWLMGSFSDITMSEIVVIAPIVLLTLVPLQLASWKLNVLSFGEEEASALGINVRRLRAVVICCASLMTGSVVAVSGLIGWVGLIIPHLTRFIVGANHRLLLPAS
ncbi:MAG: iron ABC transporter permease, partial [Prevotellaceae bacterium]|nr:iron ABC transporter permease [Prevotellaceae bacterium]